MLDIKSIRENANIFDAEFARRNIEPISAKLIEIDKRRRYFQTQAQEIQTARNKLSQIIGQKKAKGEDAEGEIKKVSHSKKAQVVAEEKAKSNEEWDKLTTSQKIYGSLFVLSIFLFFVFLSYLFLQ